MWVFDKDFNKWTSSEDKLEAKDFNYLKQELSSTRLYSKCLSGSTYLPINNLDNIYDILGEYEPRNWYIRPDGSQYTNTTIPKTFNKPINKDTSYEYYEKYISEYGLTLKNLFTPDRLIKDSINNYIYVDLATTEQIDNINAINLELYIDGIKAINGHRILLKNQISIVTLPNNKDPETYFKGNYTKLQDYGGTIQYSYFNENNGVYEYKNGSLVKTNDLEEYSDCVRYSLSIKLGVINNKKQFHLSRLLNGYYPTSSKNEPVEFIEKNNWMLRNRMDYNNLFEINYYDIKKFEAQSFIKDNITFSIPERTISIGEFGIILNTQYGTSTIIANKYKVNLRCISETEKYYWIVGDDGLLLKISKSDFSITKIESNTDNNLKSISFFNDIKGVIVGDLNTILITNNGGVTWEKLIVDEFKSYNYNKVIFYNFDKIFIIGNIGVFLELEQDISGWDIYKRRISRFIDDYEEYLLVDNILDMSIYSVKNWGLTFSHINETTLVNKELMFLTTEESKVIIYDLNDSIPNFDFLFLDFNEDYGNINNIIKLNEDENYFFISWNNLNRQGISVFDLNLSNYIGLDNKYSNTLSKNNATQVKYDFFNKITSFNNKELLMCSNESKTGVYSYDGKEPNDHINFEKIDASFDSRLISKLLFLDYDIASKLNFFTDNGDYRLPNDVKFNLNSSINDVVFSSTQSFIIYENSYSTNKISVSGLNTYNRPKDIEIVIKLSNDDLKNIVINAKSPDGKIINLKRVDNAVGTSINTEFTTKSEYIKFSSSTSLNYSQKFQMDKNIGVGIDGYSSNIEEFVDIIDGDWTLYISNYKPFINPVKSKSIQMVQSGTFSGWDIKFLYGSDDEIDITSTGTSIWFEPINIGTQSEVNWIEYIKDREKTFEYYSITPLDDSTKVLMSTTFSFISDNSLNNISISIGGATNSISDIKRIAPSSLNNDQSKFDALGLDIIQTPINDYDLYLYDYIAVLKVKNSFVVSIGDIIRLESNIIDTNLIVNKIESFLNEEYKLVYMFSNFNDNIISGLCISNINITNLNRYNSISELYNNFNNHNISNGYDLEYDNVNNFINISAKFNNLTSYYNLATKVIIDDSINVTEKIMSYTDGFLKFGYTPTYNILDYLLNINDNNSYPKFTADKEYLSMPEYIGIPMPSYNSFSPNEIYIEYNKIDNNKIYFGTELKLEWESLFLNTFVDIVIHDISNSMNTDRLLIMNKYIDTSKKLADFDIYVIEFNKKMNYVPTNFQYSIDIKSRRRLIQISNDLQELNNIHRAKLRKSNIIQNSEYNNFERENNFKIPTDSYAKILLSDVDTIRELSALVYIDYKNELAVNITRLESEYNIPIQTVSSYLPTGYTQSKLYIRCSYNHDLKTGDGVVLDFSGTQSDANINLNPNYFGYHNVTILDNLSFYVDTPFGVNSIDAGFVKYVKKDPFLNYEPVDIIDIGVDKRGKNSVEIDIDNLYLKNNTYSLKNINFNKYRFRLVDGLTVEMISQRYPWILEAEISDAVIGTNGSDLIWYKGNWECGRWFGGIWISGTWKSGDWYGGIWNSQNIKDNLISIEVSSNTSDKKLSNWISGRWYGGTWNNGTWNSGRWYGGTWNSGDWYKGMWNDGVWNSGNFSGGVWVKGTWNSGIFNCDNEPAYWIDGKWNGGDFENGMWYNGVFEEKNNLSRFGTKAYNSRTARWQSGKWLSGSFYSKLSDDLVSKSHSYSIWNTGIWYSGDIHGGIVYNIDFKSGNWYGGISEEIQIIQIDPSNGFILLNGIFKFNIGDEITINKLNEYFNTNRYKVIRIEEDIYNNYTKIFINFALTNEQLLLLSTNSIPQETNIRIINRFRNVNWESGIWTNGIFETGNWKGGIWYDGVFGEKAKWQ